MRHLATQRPRNNSAARKARPFYGWTVAVALWFTFLLTTGLPFYGAGAVIAVMAGSMSIDKTTIGLGFSLLTIVWGLSGPPTAALLNRIGLRLTVVLGSLIIASGAAIIGTLVQQVWTFIAIFGLVIGLGIGMASNLPAQTGVTLWFNRRRPLVISLVMTASGIGGFFGPTLLNRIMGASNDWRTAWLFIAATCVACAAIAAIFLRNRPADLGQWPDGIEPAAVEIRTSTDRTQVRWKPRDALRAPIFWQILLAAIIFSAPIPMLVAHGVIHFESLGHSAPAAARAIGLMVLLSVPGRVLGGVLCNRFPAQWVWASMMLMMSVGLVVASGAYNGWNVILFEVLIGVGFGACIICWASITASIFGASSFATVMGLMAPVSMLATSVAPILAGAAYDKYGSYATALWTCSAALLVGAVMIGLARSPGQRQSAGGSTAALAPNVTKQSLR